MRSLMPRTEPEVQESSSFSPQWGSPVIDYDPNPCNAPHQGIKLPHRRDRVFCVSDLLCITIKNFAPPILLCAFFEPSTRANLALFQMYFRSRKTMMECDLETRSYLTSGEPICTLTDALGIASQWASPPCDKYWYWPFCCPPHPLPFFPLCIS